MNEGGGEGSSPRKGGGSSIHKNEGTAPASPRLNFSPTIRRLLACAHVASHHPGRPPPRGVSGTEAVNEALCRGGQTFVPPSGPGINDRESVLVEAFHVHDPVAAARNPRNWTRERERERENERNNDFSKRKMPLSRRLGMDQSKDIETIEGISKFDRQQEWWLL